MTTEVTPPSTRFPHSAAMAPPRQQPAPPRHQAAPPHHPDIAPHVAKVAAAASAATTAAAAASAATATATAAAAVAAAAATTGGTTTNTSTATTTTTSSSSTSTESLLDTTPFPYNDNKSQHYIYRYLPDPTTNELIAREDVLDFFYPHVFEPGGSAVPQAKIAALNMRRDVFLLAFAMVQRLDATDRWSFYQIAGIHGVPYETYDDVKPDPNWDPFNTSWWGGYCQHGTPLFPTWHRPYMLLLEQSIIRQATLLASTLKDSDEQALVKDLASKIRFPYWDWGSTTGRSTGVPDVFTTTDIDLYYPWKSFTYRKIANPLKAFVVPRDVGKPSASSDVYNPPARPNYVVPETGQIAFTPAGYATVRHVTPSYQSNSDFFNVRLLTTASTTLVDGLNSIFLQTDWLPFSNHSYKAPDSGTIDEPLKFFTAHLSNLEGVHDNVHGYTGGKGGHMGYNELAAFDPIFFFHHCNVDRLLALWQYCNPDSWIPEDPTLQNNPTGTFTMPTGSPAIPSTELTPFRLPNGAARTYLNSNDVRWVEKDCGYTYPELIMARTKSWTPDELRDYIRGKLYNPPQNFKARWVLVMERLEKRAFHGSFSIRVFIGKPDADANTSTKSPSYAGDMTVFTRASSTNCPNCDNNLFMNASVDITKTLLRLGIVADDDVYDDDPVDPFSEATADNHPLSVPGAITLVFVDSAGRPLNKSGVSGDGVDDGYMLSIVAYRNTGGDPQLRKYNIPS